MGDNSQDHLFPPPPEADLGDSESLIESSRMHLQVAREARPAAFQAHFRWGHSILSLLPVHLVFTAKLLSALSKPSSFLSVGDGLLPLHLSDSQSPPWPFRAEANMLHWWLSEPPMGARGCPTGLIWVRKFCPDG